MEKTSILFVMGFMNVGGIEKSLIRLCKALDPVKYGITVLLLCVGDGISNELPDYVTKLFVSRKKTRSFEKQYKCLLDYESILDTLYNKPCNKIKKRMMYQALKLETSFFKKYVKSLFVDEHFDVCVGFMQGEPSDIAMSCINAKRKVVFYRHGTVFEFLNDKEYYRKADKIIALSKGVKKELISKRSIPEDKIEIIHNVYDIESIKEKSKEPCVFDREQRIKIVTVARISSEKGITKAIKAAKQLKDNKVDFIWIFVGKNEGNYYEECKQEVLINDLADNVFFTGVQTNPYPFFRTADIYVQPSECEALPGTIVEALAVEKPIVSTKTYGALELITNGENGLLCNYQSNEIFRSIKELVDNPDLRQNLVNGSKASTICLEHEIEKYEELFNC